VLAPTSLVIPVDVVDVVDVVVRRTSMFEVVRSP
jgi:hypothetical protein